MQLFPTSKAALSTPRVARGLKTRLIDSQSQANVACVGKAQGQQPGKLRAPIKSMSITIGVTPSPCQLMGFVGFLGSRCFSRKEG